MERIRSKTAVVCDAGPIIHLDEVGCLSLLNDFKSFPGLLLKFYLKTPFRPPKSTF